MSGWLGPESQQVWERLRAAHHVTPRHSAAHAGAVYVTSEGALRPRLRPVGPDGGGGGVRIDGIYETLEDAWRAAEAAERHFYRDVTEAPGFPALPPRPGERWQFVSRVGDVDQEALARAFETAARDGAAAAGRDPSRLRWSGACAEAVELGPHDGAPMGLRLSGCEDFGVAAGHEVLLPRAVDFDGKVAGAWLPGQEALTVLMQDHCELQSLRTSADMACDGRLFDGGALAERLQDATGFIPDAGSVHAIRETVETTYQQWWWDYGPGDNTATAAVEYAIARALEPGTDVSLAVWEDYAVACERTTRDGIDRATRQAEGAVVTIVRAATPTDPNLYDTSLLYGYAVPRWQSDPGRKPPFIVAQRPLRLDLQWTRAWVGDVSWNGTAAACMKPPARTFDTAIAEPGELSL